MIDGEEQGESIEPTDNPQEGFQKPELPSRFTLYNKVLDELKEKVSDYKARKIQFKYSFSGGLDKPIDDHDESESINRFEFSEIKPLALPSVGIDGAILEYIEFDKLDRTTHRYDLGTLQNHDIIILRLRVFNEDSPHVAEEDDLSDDLSSLYFASLGREMEPIITQYSQATTPDSLDSARQHKLTDLESERILDCVKTLKSSVIYIYDQERLEALDKEEENKREI